jgi:acetyl-CoA synthetase
MMAAGVQPGIESVLHETRHFSPSAAWAQGANVDVPGWHALGALAEADPVGFWAALARDHLTWTRPFETVLDDCRAPFYQWFSDGDLSLSWHCLDRHAAATPDKVALIWHGDDGTERTVTYPELLALTCQIANALRASGVSPGDRVVIYMPQSIEAVAAMHACARIGAVHSVVFAGFSAKSLADRLADTGARVVLTANAQRRAGKVLPLKPLVDEAIALLPTPAQVGTVVVWQRTNDPTAMTPGRDRGWDDWLADHAPWCPPPSFGAEQPLFILYTSGSTGKPKGILHTTGGYLLWALLTMHWVFDLKPATDVFWCTADLGWITGHTYLAYGPLAAGATQLMVEGTPTWPHAGRFWELIDRYQVTQFYTAPTAIRALIKADEDGPSRYELSSLRLLGSVGEPINPEAWMWFYRQVGRGRCPIVDTWWQTETGGHMMAPLPGVATVKPGSCWRPLPGIRAEILNPQGEAMAGEDGGYLSITQPWPSMARGLWGDPERFQATYFPEEPGGGRVYITGDGAHRDAEGDYWVLGRMDDVLNVSGHRLGTMEVESALIAHPVVAEAAVVGIPHEVKGEAVVAFITLKEHAPSFAKDDRLAQELRAWVAQEIGPIAKPDYLYFPDALPKTRSGKIMRRLLRTIARGDEVTQDVSTLENPAMIQLLIQHVQTRQPEARP